MNIIACTQQEICPDECINCGGWIGCAGSPDGVPGPCGRYCSQGCAADHQDWIDLKDELNHLRIRDLLCGCGICVANGRPTDAELAEWQAHQESRVK